MQPYEITEVLNRPTPVVAADLDPGHERSPRRSGRGRGQRRKETLPHADQIPGGQLADLGPVGDELKINATASHAGRAIVFTIWQASHLDQVYFFCSDVVIA